MNWLYSDCPANYTPIWMSWINSSMVFTKLCSHWVQTFSIFRSYKPEQISLYISPGTSRDMIDPETIGQHKSRTFADTNKTGLVPLMISRMRVNWTAGDTYFVTISLGLSLLGVWSSQNIFRLVSPSKYATIRRKWPDLPSFPVPNGNWTAALLSSNQSTVISQIANENTRNY